MRRYNGYKEKADQSGVNGYVRCPLVLDEDNQTELEGPLYVSGLPKQLERREFEKIRQEGVWSVYRAVRQSRERKRGRS